MGRWFLIGRNGAGVPACWEKENNGRSVSVGTGRGVRCWGLGVEHNSV